MFDGGKAVFVVSPFAGTGPRRGRPEKIRQSNEYLDLLMRAVVDAGHTPYAPHAVLPRVLDESNPQDRERGIVAGLRQMSRQDEVWVGVKLGISGGMDREIRQGRAIGKAVLLEPHEFEPIVPPIEKPIIALEGIDASGKATHAELIRKALGPAASVFSFPAATSTSGKVIYGHLAHGWRVEPGFGECTACKLGTPNEPVIAAHDRFDSLVFQLVQSANRLENLGAVMQAAARGPVILDRWWYSAIAYGVADGLDRDFLLGLHAGLRRAFDPDYKILLDLDPKVGAERRPHARDRYERDRQLITAARGVYRELWAEMGWPIVDANRPVAEVHAEIMGILGYEGEGGA